MLLSILLLVTLFLVVLVGSYSGTAEDWQPHIRLAVDTAEFPITANLEYLLEISLIFLVIIGVTWLSFLKIKNCLSRARQSEVFLKTELDRLTKLIHDLASPITAIALCIEQLDISNGQNKESLRQAKIIVKRLIHGVQSVKNELNSEPRLTVNVQKTIDTTLNTLRPILKAHKITIRQNRLPNCYCLCNPINFERALGNIIVNAYEALLESQPSNPTITISLYQEGALTSMAVSNNGPIIPTHLLKQFFDQGFSTKNSSGLGLLIARELFEIELKAKITATSLPQTGTTFTITWSS